MEREAEENNDMYVNLKPIDTKSNRSNSSNCKLVSLNVGGLMTKLNYPEFNEFVNNYDILCETKTDSTDNGFKSHIKHRNPWVQITYKHRKALSLRNQAVLVYVLKTV